MSQLFAVAIFLAIAVFAVLRMKKMNAAAGDQYATERARLTTEFAAQRQPGETDAVFVGMGTHKLTKNRQFYVALTNRRLFLSELAGPMRVFDRNSVKLQAVRATWTTHGNVQMTTSHGWEVQLALPDGESHSLRMYNENAYDPAHGLALATFTRELGVA
jgi:hypothetical protein